jgi:hypothetical protein
LSQRDFVQFHGLGLSTLTKWLLVERLTGVVEAGLQSLILEIIDSGLGRYEFD